MPAKRSAASAGAAQEALAVAAPLLLAAVERGAAADRDERVLEQRAPWRVGVDVAGGDGGDPEVLGEVAESRVAADVAALVGTLQLDEEALAAERRASRGGRVRVAHGEAVDGRSPRGRSRPSACSSTNDWPTEGASGSRSSRPARRVPAWASVRMRHRFA